MKKNVNRRYPITLIEYTTTEVIATLFGEKQRDTAQGCSWAVNE